MSGRGVRIVVLFGLVIVLLAIVVNFSNIAPLFLQRLLDYSDGSAKRTFEAFVRSVTLGRGRGRGRRGRSGGSPAPRIER